MSNDPALGLASGKHQRKSADAILQRRYYYVRHTLPLGRVGSNMETASPLSRHPDHRQVVQGCQKADEVGTRDSPGWGQDRQPSPPGPVRHSEPFGFHSPTHPSHDSTSGAWCTERRGPLRQPIRDALASNSGKAQRLAALKEDEDFLCDRATLLQAGCIVTVSYLPVRRSDRSAAITSLHAPF